MSFLSGRTLISIQTSFSPKTPFPISWNSNQACSFHTISTLSWLISSKTGLSQSRSSQTIQLGSLDSRPFWSMYLSPIFRAIEILSSQVTCILEMMQFSLEQMPKRVILLELMLEKVRRLTCFRSWDFRSSILISMQKGIRFILEVSFLRSSD